MMSARRWFIILTVTPLLVLVIAVSSCKTETPQPKPRDAGLLAPAATIANAASRSADERRRIYLELVSAHQRAMKYADHVVPVAKPITPGSGASLRRNSEVYDREFARLARPTLDKHHISEIDADILFEEEAVSAAQKRPARDPSIPQVKSR